jgi:hypothetical protein
MVPKYSQEDTFFTTKNGKGENITVPVPKGTYLALDVPGLHYNRQFCSLFHSSSLGRIGY